MNRQNGGSQTNFGGKRNSCHSLVFGRFFSVVWIDFNIIYLILEKRRLQMIGFQIANQYDIAVARLRNALRQACRRRRIWRKPGRLPESEWKKNFRMDRGVFMTLADELAPYLRPGRSTRSLIITSPHSQPYRFVLHHVMALCQQKSTLTPRGTLPLR